jgi:hypothetical protein
LLFARARSIGSLIRGTRLRCGTVSSQLSLFNRVRPMAVFIIAQVLSYPYLAAPDLELLDEWRERARRRDAAPLPITSV